MTNRICGNCKYFEGNPNIGIGYCLEHNTGTKSTDTCYCFVKKD